jgi:hypothetical protein
MTTYQSLLATAGKLPALDIKETDEDYLKRLVLAVSSVPIPAFEAMPDDARQWFEGAADALSAGMRVPVPDGFDRDTALPAQIVATHEPRVGQRIARPNGSSYVPNARVPGPPPNPLEIKPGETVRDVIVKIMLANPDLTLDGLMRKLAEHHIRTTADSVAPQRSLVVTILRLIREAGWRQPNATTT